MVVNDAEESECGFLQFMQDDDLGSVYENTESVIEEEESEEGDYVRTPFEEILCSFKPKVEVESDKRVSLVEIEKENQMVIV